MLFVISGRVSILLIMAIMLASLGTLIGMNTNMELRILITFNWVAAGFDSVEYGNDEWVGLI